MLFSLDHTYTSKFLKQLHCWSFGIATPQYSNLLDTSPKEHKFQVGDQIWLLWCKMKYTQSYKILDYQPLGLFVIFGLFVIINLLVCS